MSEDDNKGLTSIEDVVLFQINRQITYLFRQNLDILNELENQGYKFAPELKQSLRKRILDSGNDTIRSLSSLIQRLEIKLKN